MMAIGDIGIYTRRLRATLASQGAAYGFTLTVWASGMLAQIYYGPMTPVYVFLFILGPILMYAVLLVLLYHPKEAPIPLASVLPTAFAFMDFVSVPVAVAAAMLIFRSVSQPMLGLPLGSFLATLVYNLLLALQVLVFMAQVKREQEREREQHR